jgi:copper chaperone CopZ
MQFSSNYLHVTRGRLRIKIPHVKNSNEVALKVERLLGSVGGVTSAKANPFTGNVLVLFDSESIRHEDVVEAIRKQGYLKEQKAYQRSLKVVSADRVSRPNYASNILVDIILQKALELTLKQALLALL